MGSRMNMKVGPRRRRVRAGVAVALFALAAVACSDDSGIADDAAPTTSVGDTTTTDPGGGDTTVPGRGDTTSTTVPPAPGVELPPPLENADGANDALTGVGRLTGQGSDCTAFLVDTTVADASAFALTNGHCVGIFDSRTVIVDGPGGGTVAFNRFVDTDDVEVGVTSVRWATMRGVDIAVLELDATLGDLEGEGIAAYSLRPFAPTGSAIRIVGVPVTGVDPDGYYLRASDCAAAEPSRLLEFVWLWDAAQANDCDAIVGGNSGSPVFDATGDVVGIVNTTTVAASPGGECYLGHPCEVTADGADMSADTSYAIPVDGVAECFTAAGEFDVSTCDLEPGTPSTTLMVTRPAQQSPATWQLTIEPVADATMSTTSAPAAADAALAGKAGPIGDVDCRDATGYEAIDPSAFAPPVPIGEGFQIACLATVDGAAVDVTAASFAILQVDDTPPVVAPELHSVQGDDGYSVEPIFATPELSGYDMKIGPAATTDCDDQAGYRPYRRIPTAVDAADLPAAVCVIGYDLADNATPPTRFELD